MEHVILVDEHDVEIGTMEKMEAHRKGVLHRAFSILVFNSAGDLLLQQRAPSKYHSGNLWTNTCCSHPKPGESILVAARRRLKEEMGIQTPLSLVNKFIYTAELENGLMENELDYVFSGIYDGNPSVNRTEVVDWKFIPLHILQSTIQTQPDNFTPWFKIIMTHWKPKEA